MQAIDRSKTAEMVEKCKNERRKATKAVYFRRKLLKRILFCLLIWKKRKERGGRNNV